MHGIVGEGKDQHLEESDEPLAVQKEGHRSIEVKALLSAVGALARYESCVAIILFEPGMKFSPPLVLRVIALVVQLLVDGADQRGDVVSRPPRWSAARRASSLSSSGCSWTVLFRAGVVSAYGSLRRCYASQAPALPMKRKTKLQLAASLPAAADLFLPSLPLLEEKAALAAPLPQLLRSLPLPVSRPPPTATGE
eukprot:2589074-Pleurochrysis_carterae.AAC.1